MALKERSDLPGYSRRLFGRNTRCRSRSTKAKAGSGFALNASSCVLAAFGRRWGGLPRVGPVPTLRIWWSRPVALKERSDLPGYSRRLFGRNTRCRSRSTKAKAGSGFALNASSCVLASFGRRWGGLPRVGPVPTKLLAGANTPTGRILFLRFRHVG